MPRSRLRFRPARNELMRWRAGYCPVVNATLEGEQIGEAT